MTLDKTEFDIDLKFPYGLSRANRPIERGEIFSADVCAVNHLIISISNTATYTLCTIVYTVRENKEWLKFFFLFFIVQILSPKLLV